MLEAEHYMSLQYDLSGSLSKNRFRNELLWGLKKMLETYKDSEEFTVVFDYVCDIEIHKERKFEFYQVKTLNTGTYSIRKLLTKDNSGHSVLGKLYQLKYTGEGNQDLETEIALVSNVSFNDGTKTYSDREVVNLYTLEQSIQEKIIHSLKEELNLNENLNLNNSSFIRTGVNLHAPEKYLIGETSLFFEEIFGSEPPKINSLFRILESEINVKASFELKPESYNELLEKKGVSRKFLQSVLDDYNKYTDISTIKVKEAIDIHYKDDVMKKIKLKETIGNVTQELKINKTLKEIEKEIIEYIKENLDSLSGNEIEVTEEIASTINSKKTIEISNDEIKILIWLILKKFEEGMLSIE